MSGGGYPAQIFANEPVSFSRLQAYIAREAMGSRAGPEYTTYPDRISNILSMYQTSVHIQVGSILSYRRYRFMGRAMPSVAQATQMATRAAIARLRDILPILETRCFHYLPSHTPYTNHFAYPCTVGERDVAIESLIQYIMALESVFTSMVDEYISARMDLARACTTHRREFRTPSPRADRILISPYIPAAIQRPSPSAESSRLAAHVPVRASISMSTILPCANGAPPVARLEAIPEKDEEADSSATPLRLTLGRPSRIPDSL
jgi:hypothetical protein